MRKPVVMWAIRYRNGSLCTYHLRRTRKNAIESFCSNGDDPPDRWQTWYRLGLRAVKVTVQELVK